MHTITPETTDKQTGKHSVRTWRAMHVAAFPSSATGPVSAAGVRVWTREERRGALDPRNRKPGMGKTAFGGYVPVDFRVLGPSEGSVTGRALPNIVSSSPWVWIDFDGCPDGTMVRMRALLERMGVRGELFSSYSHIMPDKGERARLVVETDRELRSTDEIRIVRTVLGLGLCSELGLDEQCADAACRKANQPFWVPSSALPEQAFFWELNGDQDARVDLLLALADKYALHVVNEPAAEVEPWDGESASAEQRAEAQHAYGEWQEAVLAELEEATAEKREIKLMTLLETGEKGRRGPSAFHLGRYAGAGALDASTLHAAEEFLREELQHVDDDHDADDRVRQLHKGWTAGMRKPCLPDVVPDFGRSRVGATP